MTQVADDAKMAAEYFLALCREGVRLCAEATKRQRAAAQRQETP